MRRSPNSLPRTNRDGEIDSTTSRIRRTYRGMERLTHHVLTSDGIQISCDLYQESEREVVVIICPGFFQSKDTATFQRLSLSLAEQFDVLAMDFRGHGR